jgi:predicted nucleic acid-binding protein
LAVSLITIAEIEYGMEVKNWGANWRDLMRRFLGRFTPLLPDAETARLWAQIKSAREKKGPANHIRRRLDRGGRPAIERSPRDAQRQRLRRR